MRYLKRSVHCITAVTALISVAACTSILPEPKPAPTIYRLSIPGNTQTTTVEKSIVVNIEFPQAARALSGTDIILSPDGRRLSAAGGASWAEPVPSQVRHVLIDTLGSYNNITGVIPKGGTRAPYRLNMQILRFEAEFDNGAEAAPNAIVHITVSLTDTNLRRLIGVHSVNANARANAKTVSSIVEAQDNATRDAMDNISVWLDTVLAGKNSN